MKNITYDCDKDTDPECFSSLTAVPWETDFGALVPRFTGGLSAISSSLIIYVIIRSHTRLSSIYHRIMFGMSLADICGSIAMALTSLPMPSYMPKEEVFGYKWAGSRLGNTTTCNAQGFFSTFGMICMFHYNAMLCVYYACAIALNMRERNIQKYVEPFLHAIPLIVGLAFSVPPLFYEMYNPGISVFAWCGPVAYPDECVVYEGVECIRGSAGRRKAIQIVIAVAIMYIFAIIFISLTMVLWTVGQTDRIIRQISKMYRDRGEAQMENVLQKHRNSKAAIIQAASYIVALLLGVLPPLLLSTGAVDTGGRSRESMEFTDNFEKLTLIFLPIQGFFNFIIFISHKIYNYRRVHQDVRICKALAILFCTSAHDPIFISRISIVMKNEEEETNQGHGEESYNDRKLFEVNIHDESNEAFHFRLGLMTNVSDMIKSGDVGSNPSSEQDPSQSENASWDPVFTRDEEHLNVSDVQDGSRCFSYSSRSSVNISLGQADLSLIEEGEDGMEQEKKYYKI